MISNRKTWNCWSPQIAFSSSILLGDSILLVWCPHSPPAPLSQLPFLLTEAFRLPISALCLWVVSRAFQLWTPTLFWLGSAFSSARHASPYKCMLTPGNIKYYIKICGAALVIRTTVFKERTWWFLVSTVLKTFFFRCFIFVWFWGQSMVLVFFCYFQDKAVLELAL